MKTKVVFIYSIISLVFSSCSNAQNSIEPWSENQLITPSELARILYNPKVKQPVIYNIGPSGHIKNSIEIGETQNEKNLKKLKQELSKLPKDTSIVIYCGCCPFKNCPNIRPAFNLLNEMNFTAHQLLNLPQNLKVDWIDKGFPLSE